MALLPPPLRALLPLPLHTLLPLPLPPGLLQLPPQQMRGAAHAAAAVRIRAGAGRAQHEIGQGDEAAEALHPRCCAAMVVAEAFLQVGAADGGGARTKWELLGDLRKYAHCLPPGCSRGGSGSGVQALRNNPEWQWVFQKFEGVGDEVIFAMDKGTLGRLFDDSRTENTLIKAFYNLLHHGSATATKVFTIIWDDTDEPPSTYKLSTEKSFIQVLRTRSVWGLERRNADGS
ncbi:hypothetical protein JKP88DRAFT_288332 [Tribonema minus]|uniref:Uncharacterized protein n=1 Tax=Tribonema minus TaxID=303371 RepID=A0A835Z8V1_9STRA|nr:hypothetical protein JKP88DRAFT_288332 [Tribonema minus]